MKNPETIIRGIMHEATQKSYKAAIERHMHKRNVTPAQAKGHFKQDETIVDEVKKKLDKLEEQVQLDEKKSAAWQRSEGKDPEGGLNKKGVESYRRENPGSKLQTAVTTDPKKLKKGSKKAKRRLSFCRRMKGMKRKLTSAKTARDPDSRINKSLRKWNCE